MNLSSQKEYNQVIKPSFNSHLKLFGSTQHYYDLIYKRPTPTTNSENLEVSKNKLSPTFLSSDLGYI